MNLVRLEVFDILIAIIVWSSVIALFVSGLVATLVGLPGVWLVLIGVVVSAVHNGFEDISLWALLFFLIFAIVLSLADNFIIPLSTKYTGGSNWAVVGAVIGGIVGLLVGSVVGAFIGPFVGAVIFEFVFKRDGFKNALKAGTGTFIGFFFTVIVKFGAALGMISLWAILMFK